ncbi:MAG: molybdenum cofactor biosynthesis protein B [Myxococcota bacterium]
MPIDESRTFEPLGIAILTVSDTRTLATDTSGNLLASRAAEAGHDVRARAIVTDDVDAIQARVREWIADSAIDVVLTTGGTGVTARDVTPEAVEGLYDKAIPGFGELFRWISFETIGTSTIQSRATAGLAGTTYLFALPGSTGACRDAWDRILASQLDSRHRPCNFAELRHRL